jgi:hypothetical protein
MRLGEVLRALCCIGEANGADTTRVYSERYVAFIDILGFSSHVRQSEHSPSEAEKLVKIMNRISEHWSNEHLQNTHKLIGEDFKSQSFSDCTVLSEAATPRGLHYLLFFVTQFAVDLLANGFLCRGGIVKGLLHHSEKAVFGPAFLSAYDLEQNVADFPRIVVDQNTHKDFDLNQHPNPLGLDEHLRHDLRHADDGPLYVDIFTWFKFPKSRHGRVEIARKGCRDSIQSKLDESIYVPAHFRKLQWLASTWNTTVERESGRNEWIVSPAQRDFQRRNERTA